MRLIWGAEPVAFTRNSALPVLERAASGPPPSRLPLRWPMSIAGELRRETNALVHSVTLGSGALLIFSLAQIVEYVVMVTRAVGRSVAQQNCEDVRL